MKLAADTIDSGRAMEQLKRFVRLSNGGVIIKQAGVLI